MATAINTANLFSEPGEYKATSSRIRTGLLRGTSGLYLSLRRQSGYLNTDTGNGAESGNAASCGQLARRTEKGSQEGGARGALLHPPARWPGLGSPPPLVIPAKAGIQRLASTCGMTCAPRTREPTSCEDQAAAHDKIIVSGTNSARRLRRRQAGRRRAGRRAFHIVPDTILRSCSSGAWRASIVKSVLRISRGVISLSPPFSPEHDSCQSTFVTDSPKPRCSRLPA